ncbi:MAG TPA: hypothetical protein VEU74_02180 [Gemmatimonadales bacterium]|nr:hypothetical protein [Gemmatimonadales bacterium]
MDLSAFVVMVLSFTGAAVTVIGVIAFAIGHVRRQAARSAPGQPSTEELDELRARFAELEQRNVRLEELEERLDFVERVLGRAREAKPLGKPSEKE